MEPSEIEILQAALRGFRADRDKLDEQIKNIEARILALSATQGRPHALGEDLPPPRKSAKQLAWEKKTEKRSEMADKQSRKWFDRYTMVNCPRCHAKAGQPCADITPPRVHAERKKEWSERGGFALLKKKKS